MCASVGGSIIKCAVAIVWFYTGEGDRNYTQMTYSVKSSILLAYVQTKPFLCCGILNRK